MGQDGNVKQSLDLLLEQTNAHWETMDRTLLKLDATLRDNTAALQAATGAKMECLVCMDKERNTVILPCSHYAVCGECLVQCRNCPVCRGPMGGSIKVYVVYSGGALGLTSLL